MARITIDPITRIEGHLRIEAEVSGGKVADAWSSGTMFRGLEMILKERDPRDAWMFAQRACGVRIARHRRTGSDMQLACQAAPTRSLAAGVRTGEGVNRYFPATIENRRPREQPRLETEFVCAVRAPIRGGGGTPHRQGRDVGNRGPTGGKRAERRDGRDVWAVGRRRIARYAHRCGRCPQQRDSRRFLAALPCRLASVMASCVTTRGGTPQRRPRT